jgi:hypothetical protein
LANGDRNFAESCSLSLGGFARQKVRREVHRAAEKSDLKPSPTLSAALPPGGTLRRINLSLEHRGGSYWTATSQIIINLLHRRDCARQNVTRIIVTESFLVTDYSSAN